MENPMRSIKRPPRINSNVFRVCPNRTQKRGPRWLKRTNEYLLKTEISKGPTGNGIRRNLQQLRDRGESKTGNDRPKRYSVLTSSVGPMLRTYGKKSEIP